MSAKPSKAKRNPFPEHLFAWERLLDTDRCNRGEGGGQAVACLERLIQNLFPLSGSRRQERWAPANACTESKGKQHPHEHLGGIFINRKQDCTFEGRMKGGNTDRKLLGLPPKVGWFPDKNSRRTVKRLLSFGSICHLCYVGARAHACESQKPQRRASIKPSPGTRQS